MTMLAPPVEGAGRVLGRGRHASVVLEVIDGAVRAVKVSRTSALGAEFALLRQLAHPRVVAAHAHGRDARGDWLAMEACASCAHGPVPEPVARRWLHDAAAGLAHLHALGWVHRDVKPANLLVRADGALVIADLGSAARAGAPGADGALAGSPRHAAPEQLRGEPAAPAADVYALGTVLHEWLTGEPAFAGETPAELHAQHLIAPVPQLPRPLAHWQPLLDALLAKRAQARLPDAAAILSWNRP